MNISQTVGNTMRGLWSSSGVPTGNKLGWPTSKRNLANKVSALALATIALYAIANVPQADAGPILGAAGYWLTKSLCYGTAVGAASATVIATGGAAAGAVGTAAAAMGTTAATAVATEVTVATVASAGGIAGAIAAVESASMAVGAFLTALPTP